MGVQASITASPRIDSGHADRNGGEQVRTTYRGTIDVVVEKGIRIVHHGDLEEISLWIPDSHVYTSPPNTISLSTSLDRFEIKRDMISPVGISRSAVAAHPSADEPPRFRLGIALSIYAEPLPARVSYVVDVISEHDSVSS